LVNEQQHKHAKEDDKADQLAFRFRADTASKSVGMIGRLLD